MTFADSELFHHFLKEIRHMTTAVQALVSAVAANTDAVNAAVVALKSGSTSTGDPTDAPAIAAAVTQITANNAALNAAVAGTGGTTGGTFTPLGSAIASSVDADAGSGPFVLSGLDIAQFSVGMGPLVSALPPSNVVDPGTCTVSAVNTGTGTVTVTSTDGWKPLVGHVLGRSSATVVTTPPQTAAQRQAALNAGR